MAGVAAPWGGARSHHAVLGPGPAAACQELLEVQIDRLVNGLRVEVGVDGAQDGDDVGVGVAQPADLEAVAVDVEDLQAVFPDADLAQLAQLRSRALEE